MAAKLVVTKARGGSKITLVGTSGTELLSSKVFTEPRAKGATLRSLKGLLGDDIVVDDQTATAAPKPAAPTVARRSATKAVAATSARRATARVTEESNGSAAAKASRRPTRKPAK